MWGRQRGGLRSDGCGRVKRKSVCGLRSAVGCKPREAVLYPDSRSVVPSAPGTAVKALQPCSFRVQTTVPVAVGIMQR